MENKNEENEQNTGLLRLHSTYRHDLKCYTSDEGRCQKTAAAFLKGLLVLEGALPPILAVMVRNDGAVQEMLNDNVSVADLLQRVKKQLSELFHSEMPIIDKFREMFNEEPSLQLKKYLEEIDYPLPKLQSIYSLIQQIVMEIKGRDDIDLTQTNTYLYTNHEFENMFPKNHMDR